MSNETTLDDVLALGERIRIERDAFARMTGSPMAKAVKYSREMSWTSAAEYLRALDAMVALIGHGDELRAALEDARRLDWLGAGDDRDCYVAMDGRWTVQVGATFFGGDTLRAAIDAAQEVGK